MQDIRFPDIYLLIKTSDIQTHQSISMLLSFVNHCMKTIMKRQVSDEHNSKSVYKIAVGRFSNQAYKVGDSRSKRIEPVQIHAPPSSYSPCAHLSSLK